MYWPFFLVSLDASSAFVKTGHLKYCNVATLEIGFSPLPGVCSLLVTVVVDACLDI